MKWWAWWGASEPVETVTRRVGDLSISEPATNHLALTIIREQKAELADLRRRLDTWMRIAEGATRDRREAEAISLVIEKRLMLAQDDREALTAQLRARAEIQGNLERAHRESAQEIDWLRTRLERAAPKGRRAR